MAEWVTKQKTFHTPRVVYCKLVIIWQTLRKASMKQKHFDSSNFFLAGCTMDVFACNKALSFSKIQVFITKKINIPETNITIKQNKSQYSIKHCLVILVFQVPVPWTKLNLCWFFNIKFIAKHQYNGILIIRIHSPKETCLCNGHRALF